MYLTLNNGPVAMNFEDECEGGLRLELCAGGCLLRARGDDARALLLMLRRFLDWRDAELPYVRPGPAK